MKPPPSAFGAWMRQGVVLFIDFLETLFDIHRTRTLIITIGQPVPDDVPITGGSALAITINNEQKVHASVQGRDADGQAVPVSDLEVEITNQPTPPVFTVEKDADGQGFTVSSVEPANEGDITVGNGTILVTGAGQELEVIVD